MRSKAMGVKSNNENQPILTMKKLVFLISAVLVLVSQLSAQTLPPVGNLIVHLKADDLSTAGPINTWSDASGNGHDATQDSSGLQPTVVLNALNGKPVVRFDGVNEFMSTGTGAFISSQPNTVFIIGKTNNLGSGDEPFIAGTNTSNRHNVLVRNGLYRIFAGTGQNGGAATTNFALITAVFNAPTGSSLWINQSQRLNNVNAGSESLNGLNIGSNEHKTQFLDGDIAEILVFDTVLSESDRKDVECYLLQKWLTGVLELASVDLQYSEDGNQWFDANGDLTAGFDICIDPDLPASYQLGVDNLTLNPTGNLMQGVLNPFYLKDVNDTTAFFTYWADKGVDSNASGWQGQMWDIINGNLPFFYVKDNGNDIILVDGLHYLLNGGEPILTLPGDYPQATYTYSGTLVGENGCSSELFDIVVTFNTIPSLLAVTLEYYDGTNWVDAGGDLAGGFELCLDSTLNGSYELGVHSLSLNPTGSLLQDSLHPFYLSEISDSASFYAYWSGKGVDSGASGWQAYMWEIINGNEPFFYLKDNGTDTILVDGLHHFLYGGEPILTLPGDYPQATYTYTGSIFDENGCESHSIDIEVTFNTMPAAPTANNQSYCYDGTEKSAGATPPAGSSIIWYTSETGFVTVLTGPTGTNPGTYELWASSQDNLHGCMSKNRTKVTLTIHPIPLPVFALNGSTFGSGHSQEFCNGDTVILAFDHFLGGAGTLPLTIDYDVNIDGSLTPDATLSQTGVSIAAIGQELFNSPALAPGEYFIEVTSIVDSNGCSVTNPESVYYLTITIHPTPAPIFALNGNTFGSGYGEEFCYGENITLTFDQFLGSAGTLPLTIDYDVFIDGSTTPDATLSQTGVSITAVDQELFNSSSLAAGEYSIEVTSIVDSNGCSVTDPENVYFLTITVNPIPAPIFALNGSAFGSGHTQEFCDGDTIILAFEQFLGGAGTLPLTIDYNVYIDGSLTPDATLSQSAVSITAAGQVLFSSNALAPGEYFVEVTSIEDDNGCVVTNPESIYYLTIIVHDLPVVGLNIPWTRICNNETGVKLTGGTPAGGLYSGNGVFNGNFFPALVAPGAITITYTYTDTNQCSKPATDQVIVDSVPVVTLAAIAALCADAPSLTLSGGYPAGGTFSGPHVSAGVFNTAAAGPGSYTITYRWEDGMGCIGTATRPLIVHPLPVVNIAAPYEICMDAPPLTLTGATPVGGTWTGTGISGNAFDPATLAAGNYLLTYTYTDTNGCTSFDTATMTIHPLPVANAGQDDEICLGQCFQLSASGGVQYAWSNGINTGSQQVCPVITTTYTVTVTDQHGCQDTDDITITVYPVPDVVNEQHSVCSGDCIDLVAPLGTSYIWSTGETTKIKQTCPTSNSAYIVTVTNEFGCATVSTYQVSVKPLPEVFAGSDKTICAGQPAILLATGATTYEWSTGATTAQITVTPVTQTTYTVTGTALNGCTATDQVVVNVNPLPVIGFSPASPEVCAGSCITLTASGGILYNWAHGPSGAQVSVCPTLTQTYTVSVTDNKGCTGTGQIQVNVNPLPVVYAGKDTSVFAGGSYVLDLATASGTGALQYAWSPAVTLDNPALLHPAASPYASTNYTLLVTDSKGCKGSDQVLIDVLPVGNTVAGQVVYDNSSQTPMPGFKIIVTSLSSKAADTIVAGSKGMFYLNNIPDGNYVISGTTDQNWGWGGVNATDALFSMRHFVELDTLMLVRLLAGDVNSSQQVNSSDALLIAQRFSGIIQSFIRGNWVMAPDTIVLSGGTLFSKQFSVLCVGDVNGSYNPFLKAAPVNGLLSSTEVSLNAGSEIRVPVSLNSDGFIGAISLELIVPTGIDIQGAELAPGVGGYLSSGMKDGKFVLAWFNPSGHYVTEQEPVIYLELRTHSQPGMLRFVLGNEAEITDQEGRVMQQAVVDIPALKLLNMKDVLNVQVYPNPMRDLSNLSFYLPYDGQLRVDLLNLLGEAVINITDGFRTAGEHNHVVDMSALPAGTYLIRWQYDSPSDPLTHYVKVVRLK